MSRLLGVDNGARRLRRQAEWGKSRRLEAGPAALSPEARHPRFPVAQRPAELDVHGPKDRELQAWARLARICSHERTNLDPSARCPAGQTTTAMKTPAGATGAPHLRSFLCQWRSLTGTRARLTSAYASPARAVPVLPILHAAVRVRFPPPHSCDLSRHRGHREPSPGSRSWLALTGRATDPPILNAAA
jgi:hypothetical protein